MKAGRSSWLSIEPGHRILPASTKQVLIFTTYLEIVQQLFGLERAVFPYFRTDMALGIIRNAAGATFQTGHMTIRLSPDYSMR